MVENKNKQETLIAKKKIFSNYNSTFNSRGLANNTQKSFGSLTNSFAEKAMETMSMVTATQNAIDSMDMNFNAQKTFDLMSKNFAREVEREAMETMSLSSVAQKVMDSMKMNFNMQKTIELMSKNYALEAEREAMQSMSLSSVAQRVIDSMKMDLNMQKTIELMNKNYALEAEREAMQSMSLSSAAQKVMDSLINNEAFYRSIASLAQPTYCESAICILNKNVSNYSSNLSYEDIHFNINALEDDIKELSIADNQTKFSDVFAKIPLQVQTIIIFIFLQIILPHINNISANLITPYVNEYLLSSHATDKNKIKKISKINLDNPVLEMNKLRFITKNNVILRSGPSTKAEIIDELCLGQVVTVLSKKRNWIEVQYIYQDNEILHGWVFTRYTARFKQ
jgi:hypothetical protein